MEQVNLAQQEKKLSLRDKLGRALRLSIVPLVLLASGCVEKGDSVSSKPNLENPKIGLVENELSQEETDKKMILDSLARVSGGPQGVETLDDGDLAILIGDEIYRIDDEAKEKILTIIKENNSESGLGLNFEKTEIKFQTIAVKKEILDSCQKLSLDLTPKIQGLVKAKDSLRELLNKSNQENDSYKPEAEIKTNPEIKDFL